jgi:hypothetical protein
MREEEEEDVVFDTIEKVVEKQPILPSFSERCSFFIACIVTEGVRVSVTKHFLDRYVPLSSTLSHLSRVKKITPSNSQEKTLWHILICPENEFASRMASETASSTPSLSTRSTPSSTDEEITNMTLSKTVTTPQSWLVTEHPSPLLSLVNETSNNSILKTLARLASGGFFKTSVCVIPNLNKEEFKKESEISWPMIWFVPKGTQPVTLISASLSPSTIQTSSSDVHKIISAVDHAYFLWGLRRAFQCAGSTRISSNVRGCVIARQSSLSIDKNVKNDDNVIVDAKQIHLENVIDDEKLYTIEGLGSCQVLQGEGAGGGVIVVGFDPTQTAVMRAIDCVAESHRQREAAARGSSGTSTIIPKRSLPSSRNGRGEEKNDSFVGTKRRRELIDDDTSSSLSFSSFRDTTSTPSATQQYICTGLDAFLTHEPDLFDSMALLHSRVSRVIYGLPDDIAGAIGGVDERIGVEDKDECVSSQQFKRPQLRLQEVKALNHHYSVYRISLR